MSFKKILCVAALAALPSLSQASVTFESEMLGVGPNNAVANAQNLGTLTTSGITVFGSRLDALPGGSSVDFFSFFLSQAAAVSMAVNTPTGASFGNDPIVGLFSNTGTLIAYDDDGGTGYDSLLTQNLLGGTYYVAVSGYSSPNIEFSGNGGDGNWPYELNLTSVTAVPEPESYAMLLAGLGLMGTIARRRSKSKGV